MNLPTLNPKPNRISSSVGRHSCGCPPSSLLFALFLLAFAQAGRGESILKSKHNLSAGSTAAIRAQTNTEVCIFCHTPHRSTKDAPLWNHASSGATYTPYSSSTAKARIGQPTGASKVCLSCHDGTVALGSVHSLRAPIPFRNGIVTLPAGKTLLGTDLSGDHPISFVFDSALAAADGQLQSPQTLSHKVKLDHSGQMQCTSCHDPHNNQFGQFLVEDNTGSPLCLTCHEIKPWAASAHATSSQTWSGVGINPWPHTSYKTVAANACENCHTPHTAGGKSRLLNFANDENNCYSCHSGSVAAKNIAAEFAKPSLHPILLSRGTHDAAENPLTAPRHVTCVDCHDPHASSAANPSPALVQAVVPRPLSAAIAGVTGINTGGSFVKKITSEDELCYKCHADSFSKKQALVPRQFTQTNTRLQFSSGNASFHPIQASGRNPRVPSLILPWRENSRMLCTDCHNNDQAQSLDKSVVRGPHGSIYSPLLERQQLLTDFTPESPVHYALCYKCHSRSSLLSDQSFRAANNQGVDRGHRFHIVDQQTACTTCHDPHGVPTASHLINFNKAYVTPSAAGQMTYTSTGPGSGTCTLTCHGFSHAATAYPSPPFGARTGAVRHR